MKIEYRGIYHGAMHKAPFVGALIVPKYWRDEYLDSEIEKYLSHDIEIDKPKTIIQKILKKPVNQGIILGGLDWVYQPLELVQLAKLASENGLLVMIDTCVPIEEFYKAIGKHAIEFSAKFEAVKQMMDELNDDSVDEYVGALILDYFIGKEYYIKAGLHEPKFYVISMEGEDEQISD